jgi:hypothetical protein
VAEALSRTLSDAYRRMISLIRQPQAAESFEIGMALEKEQKRGK